MFYFIDAIQMPRRLCGFVDEGVPERRAGSEISTVRVQCCNHFGRFGDRILHNMDTVLSIPHFLLGYPSAPFGLRANELMLPPFIP